MVVVVVVVVVLVVRYVLSLTRVKSYFRYVYNTTFGIPGAGGGTTVLPILHRVKTRNKFRGEKSQFSK